ncbi:MAG: Asp23/Gls24 family envelope stress response protein [Clostridiales bacterium]|nr:Asp23/Gls24 family envelope stress response protein [Clostridiales bacterium]
MAIKIVNNMGVISIDNDIIENLAAITALECYGIAGLAAKDSGKAEILSEEDFDRAISLKFSGNSINIDIHVIVEYGAGIQSVGDNVIEAVKTKVGEYTGVKVVEVGVFIEGVAMD